MVDRAVEWSLLMGDVIRFGEVPYAIMQAGGFRKLRRHTDLALKWALTKRKLCYNMKTMARLNDQVIRAIETCGMSRYKLARVSGVSEGELCRVVAGQRSMTLRTLERLAPHIGVQLTVKRPRKGRKGR